MMKPEVESTAQRTLAKLREEVERRAGKSAEEIYEEREQLIENAIQLRPSERTPVVIGGGNFAARYCGLPLSSAYYDAEPYIAANIKVALDFQPDAFRGVAVVGSAGLALEALDVKHMRWPGGNLPPDVPYQFVEGEYMKEEEYDLFLSDPTDFTLRCHLPRMYGALAPLAKLPALKNLSGVGFLALGPLFASPDFQQLGEALLKAGQAQAQWNVAARRLEQDLRGLGFPPLSHFGIGVGQAPFDTISDFYRGMRGSMLDLYRCPDKLLEACEKIFQWRLAAAAPADRTKKGSPTRVFMALHRGSEGFMSRKQFERFYWPGLKKALLANIDLGYVPMPFFEGKCDDRLEYLLELPKGKIVCHFDRTDMARAKEILKGHLCIMGNVPASLLQVGSPAEVEDCCKNLIKACGKGGGFILTPGGPIDEAKPENIKAMIDSVKKYTP
jgi:hypothetical protein